MVKIYWPFKFYSAFLNALSSLILHEMGFQYDRFLHFSDGFLAFIIAVLIFILFWALKKEQEINKNKIILSFIAIFTGIFFYELLQYSIDRLFGTQLFFDIKQSIEIDVREDIILSFLGLIFSAIYVNYFFEKFKSLLK